MLGRYRPQRTIQSHFSIKHTGSGRTVSAHFFPRINVMPLSLGPLLIGFGFGSGNRCGRALAGTLWHDLAVDPVAPHHRRPCSYRPAHGDFHQARTRGRSRRARALVERRAMVRNRLGGAGPQWLVAGGQENLGSLRSVSDASPIRRREPAGTGKAQICSAEVPADGAFPYWIVSHPFEFI